MHSGFNSSCIDFNYNFIKISNSNDYELDYNKNTFSIDENGIPCTITFSYSPICKMGIV